MQCIWMDPKHLDNYKIGYRQSGYCRDYCKFILSISVQKAINNDVQLHTSDEYHCSAQNLEISEVQSLESCLNTRELAFHSRDAAFKSLLGME